MTETSWKREVDEFKSMSHEFVSGPELWFLAAGGDFFILLPHQVLLFTHANELLQIKLSKRGASPAPNVYWSERLCLSYLSAYVFG